MAERSGVSVDARLLKRLKAALATADLMGLPGAPRNMTQWINEAMAREAAALEARIESARAAKKTA